MNDIFRFTMLFDFYSELLTSKQRLFFELYYFNDLSLQEIGDEQGISPQGVRDLIKRTEKNLLDYESKLKLIEKYDVREKQLTQIFDCLAEIEQKNDSLTSEIDLIKKLLTELKD